MFEDIGQEGIDRLGRLGHLVAQDMGGGVLIAQQFRLFFLELEDIENDLLGIVLISVVAAVRIGLEHRFAFGAVFLSGHHVGILRDRDAELGLEGIVLLEEIVAEAVAQRRKLGVDLFHPGLAGFVQGDAVVREGTVHFVEHHFLLTGQAEGFFLLVDGFDFGEEILVEGDLVVVLRGQGRGLFHDFLKFRAVVGFRQIEQDAADFGQQAAGQVESGDHVVEGRRFGIVDDGLDLGIVLTDSLLQGRNVVGILNLFERRDAERGVPFREEGIGAFFSASCHSDKGQYNCK